MWHCRIPRELYWQGAADLDGIALSNTQSKLTFWAFEPSFLEIASVFRAQQFCFFEMKCALGTSWDHLWSNGLLASVVWLRHVGLIVKIVIQNIPSRTLPHCALPPMWSTVLLQFLPHWFSLLWWALQHFCFATLRLLMGPWLRLFPFFLLLFFFFIKVTLVIL